jgi:hypothetical protein
MACQIVSHNLPGRTEENRKKIWPNFQKGFKPRQPRHRLHRYDITTRPDPVTKNIKTTKIYILQMQATHWSSIQRNGLKPHIAIERSNQYSIV